MKVLLAVKGSESEGFYRRAAVLIDLRGASDILLVHVIDAGHREGMDFGRERYLGQRALGSERRAEMERAEEERAEAGVRFGQQVLLDSGVPLVSMRHAILRGKPNELLRELAEREAFDLIVVAAARGKPGPHSLGKTARFLVDHAPRAAMLIR